MTTKTPKAKKVVKKTAKKVTKKANTETGENLGREECFWMSEARLFQAEPHMVPNEAAGRLVQDLFEQAAKAFRMGLLNTAEDWGVIIAFIHVFAEHVQGIEDEAMGGGFDHAIQEAYYNAPLALVLLGDNEDDWANMDKQFIEFQKGNRKAREGLGIETVR